MIKPLDGGVSECEYCGSPKYVWFTEYYDIIRVNIGNCETLCSA